MKRLRITQNVWLISCFYMLLFFTSCFDNMSPTPGSGLVFSGISETGMTVSWGASTDDNTALEELQYKLVYSLNNSISSVGDAEANGTAILDWSTNVLSYTVANLSAGTTYYFAVLVKDKDGNGVAYTVASQATSDDTAPATGTGLVFSSVTTTSMTVSWGAASDSVTAGASLQYKLVRSTSNNISTVSDAESNGTIVVDWSANALTGNATGLSVGTTYYFNVLVKDATGNKSAYITQAHATVGWQQQAYLKAPNNDANDQFGLNVSISGDTIVVGACYEDSNQTTITNGTTASSDNSNSSSGAAYVFTRSGTTWSQQAYLKAPNNNVDDTFGQGISISGDTIVIGSELEDSNQTTITNGSTASSDNSSTDSGAAYVLKYQTPSRFEPENTADDSIDHPNNWSEAQGYWIDFNHQEKYEAKAFEAEQ